MWKAFFAGVVLAWAWGPAAAADLSPTEQRWLRGSWPVVAYAKAAGMPLDIVVQPQPTPDLPPLALAFVDGRCKLVLSMRGNPEAEATLARIEPELLGPTPRADGRARARPLPPLSRRRLARRAGRLRRTARPTA